MSDATAKLIAQGRLPWRGHRFWWLILTTCQQGGRAPFIDRAWTVDEEGRRYASLAILLAPWRKDRWGERPRQRALVIGWRTR